MKLKVLLPTAILLEKEVVKIVAEGENGYFCLLPRHIDFVSALVPGLLAYVTDSGTEEFLAVDEGILVKCGPEVLVSTRRAVPGPELGALREVVQRRFKAVSEGEQEARAALARLESHFIRRFLQMKEYA